MTELHFQHDRIREPCAWTLGPQDNTDLLSTVLQLCRFEGREVRRCDLRSGQMASYNSEYPLFHFVEHGPLVVARADHPPMMVHSGDVLVVLRPMTHRIFSNEADMASAGAMDKEPPTARSAAADSPFACKWLTARFTFGNRFDGFWLSGLPDIVHVRSSSGTLARQMESLTTTLLSESMDGSAGSQAVNARVIEMIVVRSLRACVVADDAPKGWLRAARDPVLAHCLIDMITGGARRTVAEETSEQSPTMATLAGRFRKAMGLTPATFVKAWRLEQAKTAVTTTHTQLAKIASQAGYASTTAFSNAFKRRYGLSPMSLRRGHSDASKAAT